MSLLQRIANAFRTADRPRPGRVVVPRTEDSLRDYPGVGLTPSRLAAILREADEGSPATAMQLFEEMEEKDAHLYSVANMRRLALTGLEWRIVSAAENGDGIERAAADQAAAYCREVLNALEGFEESLQHLALALGRNVAVAEIVWDLADGELRPVALVPVDFTRLMFDEFDRLRILTEDNPRDGMELPANKFIVHAPHAVSGHAQRGGLLRVTALVYLAKNLSLKDWLVYAEVFGMPVRIARYEPTATPEEKRELLAMLESLGSNAAGIFSRAVELQIVETRDGASGPPYERLIDFLNREMSKAWLGQTLTTDISGQSGSVAAARVHEEVRADILADDMRKEARTLRRDLLAPLTRLRFGEKAPVPHFARRPKSATNPRELAEVLSVAVNQLGLKVSQAWAREALGVGPGGEGAGSLGGISR